MEDDGVLITPSLFRGVRDLWPISAEATGKSLAVYLSSHKARG